MFAARLWARLRPRVVARGRERSRVPSNSVPLGFATKVMSLRAYGVAVPWVFAGVVSWVALCVGSGDEVMSCRCRAVSCHVVSRHVVVISCHRQGFLAVVDVRR